MSEDKKETDTREVNEDKETLEQETEETGKELTPSDIPEQILTDMPPQIKSEVASFFSMIQSQSMPQLNPLFEKFNDQHVDKFLDILKGDDDNIHELRKSNRWFYIGTFIFITIVAIGLVVYLLPKDRDLLMTLVQLFVILTGGVGAGFGISEKLKN